MSDPGSNDEVKVGFETYEAEVIEALRQAGHAVGLSEDERVLVARRAATGAASRATADEIAAARPALNSMAPADTDQPTGYGSLD